MATTTTNYIADGLDYDPAIESEMYARHAEVESLEKLLGEENQRGTPIPALFNSFYKFIQNPSTVSLETFKRMVDTDDTIGSGVDFLTLCLAGRLGRYVHPSKEITDWVNDRLKEIEGGWFSALKRINSAAWAGFSVSEVNWANTTNGFVPQSLNTLPPSTILFETSRTGKITPDGILQYQRNYNPISLAQGIGFFGSASSAYGFNLDMIRPDLYAKFGDLPFPLRTANMYNYLSVRIPTVKCLHYSFDAQGNFGNPYGRSLLRRAYKWYVMKDAFLQMLATALDRKGTPLTVVFADPNTTLIDSEKTGNNPRGDATTRGKDVGISAPAAAKRAFSKIHNDTTIVLPGKKDQIFSVDKLDTTSNANDFIASIQLCDRAILRALMIPSLIFGNGDGTGSFALAETHKKVFDKVLDGSNSGCSEMVLQQLVRQMIAYNFPKSAWEKDGIGDFSKREMTSEEIEKVMEVYEKGINSGIIDKNDLNDLNKMRDSIDFEPRETPIEQPMPMGGMPGEGGFPPEGGQGAEPKTGQPGQA